MIRGAAGPQKDQALRNLFLTSFEFYMAACSNEPSRKETTRSARSPGDGSSPTATISLHGLRGAAFMNPTAGQSLMLDGVKETATDHREGQLNIRC